MNIDNVILLNSLMDEFKSNDLFGSAQTEFGIDDSSKEEFYTDLHSNLEIEIERLELEDKYISPSNLDLYEIINKTGLRICIDEMVAKGLLAVTMNENGENVYNSLI